MQQREDEMTLSTLAGGALEEKFQIELDKVLRNIDDPNAAGGKREIALKIGFKPNAKGSAADIVIASSCKLQPDIPTETMFYLGKQGAKPKAWEHDPNQMRFPFEEGDISEVKNVAKIGGMKK
jgi:hypothetical protein